MTKTLTEQWREGTLPEGLYYTRSSNGRKVFSIHTGSKSNMFSPYDKMAHQVEEVLSPVPDYKMFQFLIGEQKFTEEMLENIINIRTEELLKLNAEYIKRVKKLEKRLEIAINALNETKDRLLKLELSNLNYEERHKLYDIMFVDGVIDRALLEMEGVK